MGLAGAGLSASLGMFLGFLFFVFVTFLSYYRTRYKYYKKLGIGLHSIGQIVKILIPVSLQNVLILFGF